jgi:hypothetical protein
VKLIYLIGEPGIGKTTTMRALTGKLGPAVELDKPFAHRLGAGWMELGQQRGMFSGTDALSMSVQPLAVAFLKHVASEQGVSARGVPLVLGEGDRLTTGSFFTAVAEFADLRVVRLIGPDGLAKERRDNRGQPFTFNEKWLKGRISKVERLTVEWDAAKLNAANRPEELADELMELIER